MAAVQTTDNKQNTKPTYEELEAKLKAADTKVKMLETANAEYQNANESLAKRVEAIELSSRTEKIANIVSGAYDENVDEKIQAFVKSGLSVEEVSKIVAPLKSSKTKSASVVEYKSDVAIKNASAETKSETPAWARNYLDLLNGGRA